MKHSIRIEHPSAKDATVSVACQGKGCPLCASSAENRARLAFIAAPPVLTNAIAGPATLVPRGVSA